MGLKTGDLDLQGKIGFETLKFYVIGFETLKFYVIPCKTRA